MGLADSPHNECQAVILAKELDLENIQDRENPFNWEIVVNNLPGISTYYCC